MRARALERSEPARNLKRYYEIEVGEDLFGHWTVLRRWGRKGAHPKQLRVICRDECEAVTLAGRIEASKKRKGYSEASALADRPTTNWVVCRGSSTQNVPPLAVADPILARQVWSEIGGLQSALFEYCVGRASASAGSNGVAQDTLESYWKPLAEDELLESVINRLASLLSAGVSVREVRARLALNQSLLLSNDRVRCKRFPTSSAKIIEMIPRELHTYLDYTVGAFLPRSRSRAKIVAKLASFDIGYVGDLVQLPEVDVRKLVGNTRDNEFIKDALRSVGLRFGMRAPLWRRPRNAA